MSKANGQHVSRLESLPGELLNSIYRHAVVEDELIHAATPIDDNAKRWQTNEPALARTCRRFRREVLPIYYAENIFKFPATEHQSIPRIRVNRQHVSDWLDAIGSARQKIIRVGASVRIKGTLNEAEVEVVDVVVTISHDRRKVELRSNGNSNIYHDCSSVESNRRSKRRTSSLILAMWSSYDHFEGSWLGERVPWWCDLCETWVHDELVLGESRDGQ